MRIVLAAVLLVACGSHKDSAAPPPSPPAPAPAPAAPPPGPPVAPAAPAAPDAAPTRELVVLATITDAGPIGDGRCSQRSYQIAIDKVVSGIAPKQPFWVHFETCGNAPPPAPGNLAGTGLAGKTPYRMTLRQSASKNFGDAYMIVDARSP